MSRPKGSKNKPKIGVTPNEEIKDVEIKNIIPSIEGQGVTPLIIKRGRGRPKKIRLIDNELKENNTISGNEKDIKKEIKRLKKSKLQCRAGTPESISLGRQIKELNNNINKRKEQSAGKDLLIEEILKLEIEFKRIPSFKDLEIDLYKYTEEELKKHIEYIKKKRGLK